MSIPELGISGRLITIPFQDHASSWENVLKGDASEILNLLKKEKHAVIAGGYALYLYQCCTGWQGTKAFNDIDIFLWGTPPLKETLKKLLDKDGFITFTSRSRNHMNIIYLHEEIQVILRKYKSIQDILESFDMGCVQIAFDSENFYMTDLFEWCYTNRACIQAYTTPRRFRKYSDRGFKMVDVHKWEPSKLFYDCIVISNYRNHIMELGDGKIDYIDLVGMNDWDDEALSYHPVMLEYLLKCLGIPNKTYYTLPGYFYALVEQLRKKDLLPQGVKRILDYRLPLEYNDFKKPKPGADLTSYKPLWTASNHMYYPEFTYLGIYYMESHLPLDIIKIIFRLITWLRFSDNLKKEGIAI